jgi:hypothetical protein
MCFEVVPDELNAAPRIRRSYPEHGLRDVFHVPLLPLPANIMT